MHRDRSPRAVALAAALTLAGCGTGASLGTAGSLRAAAVQRAALPASDGGYSVLYAFAGTPDGADPTGGVIVDGNGNIFGTTRSGGTSVPPAGGAGTLFELSPGSQGYTENSVHDFGSDGIAPNAAPSEDTVGDLYATASSGGGRGSAGSVVELSPAPGGGYSEPATFDFASSHGAAPLSPILSITSGSKAQLGYSTTLYTVASKGGSKGFGSIAALSPTLGYGDAYDFAGPPADGASPLGAVAIDPEDPTLGIYGTTTAGGANNLGAVFKFVALSGVETLLHSFAGGKKDGSAPASGVAVDAQGNIYGTTQGGGADGGGVLFKLTKTKTGFTERILHAFGGSGDGSAPLAPPAFALKTKLLYGTTSAGGAGAAGTIYQISTEGAGYKTLHAFAPSTGSAPGYGGLFVTPTALYGTTQSGGAGGAGVVFGFKL